MKRIIKLCLIACIVILACLINVRADTEPFTVTCKEDEITKIVLEFSDISENVENIYARIDDKTFEIKDDKIIIDGLTKDTSYDVKIIWMLKGDKSVYSSEKVYHTAKVHAYVYQVEFEMQRDGTLYMLIKVRDTEDLMVKGIVTVDGVSKEFVKLESVVSFEGLDPDKEYDVLIVVDSKLEGDVDFSKEFKFKVNERNDKEIDDATKEAIKIDWKKILRITIIAIAAFIVVCVSYYIQKRNMKREEARKYLEESKKQENDLDDIFGEEKESKNTP